jgi:Uma2 family endonuclease
MVAEIIEGELVVSPRPALPHALASSTIVSDLGGRFGGPPGGADAPGGWWILFEPELHFGADVIVPDIAGWRRERLPAIPAAAYMEQAPDWVCEVISPRTGAVDRGQKMRIYARENVSHLWIVDPIARTLEAYRLEESGWTAASMHSGAERARVEPFAAVELDVARWWVEPPPDR